MACIVWVCIWFVSRSITMKLDEACWWQAATRSSIEFSVGNGCSSAIDQYQVCCDWHYLCWSADGEGCHPAVRISSPCAWRPLNAYTWICKRGIERRCGAWRTVDVQEWWIQFILMYWLLARRAPDEHNLARCIAGGTLVELSISIDNFLQP